MRISTVCRGHGLLAGMGTVTEAASGSGQIADNITGVSAAADSTTQALTQTRVAIDELSRMAAELRTGVSRFSY